MYLPLRIILGYNIRCQTGIIYQYQCPRINCPSSYIGESGRSLGERVKEHFKAPSPLHLHSTTTGHPMDPNQFNIVHKEVNSQSRTIKEAMFICIQDPPQQKSGQVSTTAYMGPTPTYITNVPAQANTAANNYINPITPLLVPPTSTHPPTTHLGGGQHFFLILFPMVSTYIHPKHPPSISTIRPTAAPSW